jgi:hypothetical protein
LRTTVTNENCIHEEMKSRLNSGTACYHSVQSFLSSFPLYKNLEIKVYKIIILPVVLHGCETWSVILREEYSLKVSENRVLRRIFGPKWEEVAGSWRRLHNEELHNLYTPPHIIRVIKSRTMKWEEDLTRMGRMRNAYSILVGKPAGTRPLRRAMHRWKLC